MYKIVLVEDDTQLRDLISRMLSRYGYQVIEMKDFKNILCALFVENPDVIILDINLPYLDGFEICKGFRKQSNVPIIILSARNNEIEQVMGIEFGADDYVTKPFSMEVLRAKIVACIRRAYGEYTNEKNNISFGDFKLDCTKFQVSYKDRISELSKNEFKILRCLAEKANCFIERETLLRELWDDVDFIDNNTLNVNISRIKSKLDQIGIPETINTKRGFGYMLIPYWMEEYNESKNS